MKQILGRFLLQTDKSFPIDCETMDNLQTNMAIISILGNIAGDKAIITGCELEQNDTQRKPGYVFLKTKDYPEGEIIYWEGGSVSSGMYVKQEMVNVIAQNYEFPQAYIERSLAPGIGVEKYTWSDFKRVKTVVELDDYNKKQDEAIATIDPPLFGKVEMWAGAKLPSGYALCEGQALEISEYPQLYEALGTTFNKAYSYNGVKLTTMTGFFRLPDLRGRFIVGYNASDGDYNTYGMAGGEKTHALKEDEMPKHSHPFKDYYYIEAAAGGIDGTDTLDKNYLGGNRSDKDNNSLYYKNHDTEKVGSGMSHENRPPFYTLAFIMKIK